jgi:hypothetical protein
MSRKSSIPQDANSISMALMPDSEVGGATSYPVGLSPFYCSLTKSLGFHTSPPWFHSPSTFFGAGLIQRRYVLF